MVTEPKPTFVGGPGHRWYLLHEVEKRASEAFENHGKGAKKMGDEKMAKENAKKAARLRKGQEKLAKTDERVKKLAARDAEKAAKDIEKAAKEAEKKRKREEKGLWNTKKAMKAVPTSSVKTKNPMKATKAIKAPVRVTRREPSRDIGTRDNLGEEESEEESEEEIIRKKKG